MLACCGQPRSPLRACRPQPGPRWRRTRWPTPCGKTRHIDRLVARRSDAPSGRAGRCSEAERRNWTADGVQAMDNELQPGDALPSSLGPCHRRRPYIPPRVPRFRGEGPVSATLAVRGRGGGTREQDLPARKRKAPEATLQAADIERPVDSEGSAGLEGERRPTPLYVPRRSSAP